MNFFRIKGWVEELCSGLGIDKLHFAAERENQSYHPGRCSKVWCGETYIGILGQIPPRRPPPITAWTRRCTARS